MPSASSNDAPLRLRLIVQGARGLAAVRRGDLHGLAEVILHRSDNPAGGGSKDQREMGRRLPAGLLPASKRRQQTAWCWRGRAVRPGVRTGATAADAAGRSASAATLTRWRLTSKSVTGRKAVRPARNPSAFGFHPRAQGRDVPAPVMTTRGGGDGGLGAGKSMMVQCVQQVRLVGRVTPCAPLPNRSKPGAHGVTRPTLMRFGDGLVMGGWYSSGGTIFSRLDGTPRSSDRIGFSRRSCPKAAGR